MDSGAGISLEDFRKAQAEKTAEEKGLYRAQKLDASDSTQLLWTALLPSWTISLAEASGFPVEDVAGYFEELRAKRIVDRSQIVAENDESPITVYEMDAVAREDVIDAYVHNSQTFTRVTSTLSAIGSKILKATGLETQLSSSSERIFEKLSIATPAVARFATLAANATSRPAIVSEFEKRVEAAFLRRESATIRDWINTAFPFSTLFLRLGDDSMKQALHRASQRLILLRREETDRRHLKHFYERDEQFKAFADLMTGDDSSWALHFLGAGGVGKTMLVRKITVDWAKKFDAVTARVDFDYLKAEYPTLDPGMLLWAFAQELRAYANQESINRFGKAERKFEELRSQIQSEVRSGLRQRATDYPDFAEAISDYCDALKLIPKRVLLIVDTCEELAKIGMGLTPVQNIHETFRILRALHDGAQTLKDDSATSTGGLASLRVIFSGRRPLASSGENWSCASASQLDPRPFLKVHPVLGFTKTEAESFLREKLNVDQKLIPAIIRRSPDTGSVARIEWTDAKPEPSRKLVRCNPYDLKLYADWTKEDPPPTAEQILATPPASQYVELRVLRRLHEESLKEALPAVALLGHFDRRVLQHTFGDKKTADEIEHLFDLLQQEEWINQRGVQDEDEGSNLILDIEPGIRTRLFVYYKDSPALRDFQTRAADYLEKLTLDENPSRHDWSFYDAALTVLEADPDPERVVRWWRQVDENMFKACLPEWIRNATDRMQNEGGAAAQRDADTPDVAPESRLRPAVLATYASALLRSTRRADLGVTWRELTDVWTEVLNKSDALAQQIPELEPRARAGLISASLRSGEIFPTPAEEFDHFWNFVSAPDFFEWTSLATTIRGSHLLASIVAAVEAMVDYADVNAGLIDTLIGERGVSALRKLFSPFGPPDLMNREFRQLVGFGLCLLGRAEALVQVDPIASLVSKPLARDAFHQAMDLCRFSGESIGNRRPWYDWIPPEDIASRVRLEFIRSAYGRYLGVEELVETLREMRVNESTVSTIADIRLESVDNDRLHSAYLRLLSCLKPLDENEIAKFERLVNASTAAMRLDPALESEWTCTAHQVTPPLFVTLAELRAEKGEADEILSNLASILGSRARVGYQTQLHIDRASSKIISRYRLRDVGEKGGQILAASSDIADRALAWELDAQDGSRGQQVIPALAEHLKNVEIDYKTEPSTPEQLEKLKWLHAIWQTRYVGDRDSFLPVFHWAIKNLTLGLFNPLSHFYEAASVQLDHSEIRPTARKYGLDPETGTLSLKYSDSELRSRFGPEEHLTLAIRIGALRNEQALRDVRNPSHPVVGLLGIRKVAQIVAHEADLLALRLPERAVPLYQWAQEWFDLVKDYQSEFIAATSEAMCLPPHKVKPVSERVFKIYNYIDVPGKGLANGLVINRNNKLAIDWAPRCWRPRMTRYLLLVAAETAKKDIATVGREVIETYLPGAVAVSSTGSERVSKYSADLATWLTNATQPPSLFSRVWKIARETGRYLFGLAILLTMVSLVFRGFSWAASKVVPSFPSRNGGLRFLTLGVFVTTITLSIRLALKVRQRKRVAAPADQSETAEKIVEEEYPTWRIWIDFATIWLLVALLIGPYFTELVQRWGWRLLAWTIAGVAVASLIYVFRGRFSRLGDYVFEKYSLLHSFVYTKIFKLKLEISSPQGGASTDWTLTDIPQTQILVRLVPKSRLANYFIGSPTSFLPPIDNSRRSGLEPYNRLGGTVNFRDTFFRLPFNLSNFPLMVEINLPEGPVNGLCWEAFAFSSIPFGPDYAIFLCYRRPKTLRRRARNPQNRVVGLVFAETEPARALRTAWTPTNDFEITNRESLVNGRPDVSIVHLVGSVESSYQSVGFRLGEETARLNAATSGAMSEDDALIRAEDLVRAFPNVQVCIVQEEPRAIHSDRLDGDRKDAFYARLFASQLSALGVACVITIPPLEREFGVDLVRKFAGVLARPIVKRSELLKAVAGGRREIEAYIQQHHASPATLQEVPKDLCLYLDTEWDGQLIKRG